MKDIIKLIKGYVDDLMSVLISYWPNALIYSKADYLGWML